MYSCGVCMNVCMCVCALVVHASVCLFERLGVRVSNEHVQAHGLAFFLLLFFFSPSAYSFANLHAAPSSSSLVLPQTSSSLPLRFLWPPRASSRRQDTGLLRDWEDGGGGGGVGWVSCSLSLSPTTDLWGLSPSLNICLSPCTVGD